MNENPPTSFAARHEMLLVFAWSVFVVGLSLIPYAVGVYHSTDQMVFTGHLDPYPGDYGFHMGWAKQAYDGRFLLEFQLFGDQTQTRIVVNLLVLLIGWLGRVFHLPLPVAFQVVRVVISVTLLCMVYRLAGLFFRERTWRWIALVAVSLTSGFAWLELLDLPRYWSGVGTSLPSDVDVIQISTFWHMRWEVIATPAILLLVSTFYFAMKAFEENTLRASCKAGIVSMLLGLVHPHDLCTVYLALFLFTIARFGPLYLCGREGKIPWTPWRPLTTIVAFSAPTLAYYAFVLSQEPALWGYVHQNYYWRPLQLLGGYGFSGLAGLLGCVVVVAQRQRDAYLLLSWLSTALFLAYAPFAPAGGVFALQGLHIVVCLLGTVGLKFLAERIQNRLTAWEWSASTQRVSLGTLGLVLLSLACITNVLMVSNEVAMASRSNVPFPYLPLLANISDYARGVGTGQASAYDGSALSPYFLPRELREGFDWLDQHADPSDVVLAPPYLCAFVPYLAGNRVHAHPAVPGKANSMNQIFVFYHDTNPVEEKAKFLADAGIDYVLFWDAFNEDPAEETALILLDQDAWRPTLADVQRELPLELVYENARATIFKVKHAPSG